MSSSNPSKLSPGILPRLSMKPTRLIIITVTAAIILAISPAPTSASTMTMASPNLAMKSIPGCAATKFDDLFQINHQAISLPSGIPSRAGGAPMMLGANCLISPYAMTWTGFKFFMITGLVFTMPLPLYLFLKRRLSQATCMAYRILWGFSLFFLIACVTVYVTELEGNRKEILGNLANATGNWKQCDDLSKTADLEIMKIFWRVNPLNSISKTAEILMAGMERGRQKSRVTKLLQELEMGDKEDDDEGETAN